MRSHPPISRWCTTSILACTLLLAGSADARKHYRATWQRYQPPRAPAPQLALPPAPQPALPPAPQPALPPAPQPALPKTAGLLKTAGLPKSCTLRGPAKLSLEEATPLASWLVRSMQPQVCADLNRLLASTKRGPATFDADGTLWAGDVGEGFFRWMLRNGHYPAERIPGLQRSWQDYKSGQLAGESMYELMVTSMAGMREKDVQRLATRYFEQRHSSRIYTPMQTLVTTLAATGFSPWIVSGSPRWVVEAGARHFGIPQNHVIGLSVRVDENGRLTDQIIRPVPWKEGKADRILQQLGRRPLIAAGNSQGDAYMLKIASELPLVINPARDFQRTARQRGWPINTFTPADELARIIRPRPSADTLVTDLVHSLSAL